jgi:hypothetical protein
LPEALAKKVHPMSEKDHEAGECVIAAVQANDLFM